MNYGLLNAHIESSVHEDINPVLKKDNSNLSAFFCADVVGSKKFVTNFGGWPRSEIAQINAQADINMQINLLNQLQDYSPTDNPNAGLSDAEIMLGHRSKYCQTASEQIGWLQERIALRDAKRAAAETPKDSIQFNDSDSSTHDE